MFLNAHQRLAIPASLGDVITFARPVDAGIRVPAIIGFMNDGDQDVDLHFDASNNKGQVTGTADGSSGYAISNGSSDTIKLSIDGETAVTIDLGSSTISRASAVGTINASLVAAGGNTALAQAILVGTKYIALVSGTSGQGSSVQVMTVANNAYTVLGLTIGTYTNETSFILDIVTAITVKAKGFASFTNPRPGAQALKIRGTGNGVASMIDATMMYSFSGVQQ